MNNYDFIRIGTACPNIKVADCVYNTSQIYDMIKQAVINNVHILVFGELCITGYTCGDIFLQQTLLTSCENEIKTLCEQTKDMNILFVLGAPIVFNNNLYNCAIAITKGQILGIVPKSYLPNYNEFYDKRWFIPAYNNIRDKYINYAGQEAAFGTDILFRHSYFKNICIGMEICEDLWVPIPNSSYQALNGATIILNPSASNELVGKNSYRKALISQQSARTMTAYVYSSVGFGESSTDTVFSGHGLIYENGSLLKESDRLSISPTFTFADIDIEKLVVDRRRFNSYHDNLNQPVDISYRYITYNTRIYNTSILHDIDAHPFVPANENLRNERCEDIFLIQTSSLAKRLTHIGNSKVVLGISGGLDSTLALLVCVKTFNRLNIDLKNIIGITMPGFGTTDRTYNNSIELMKHLNVTIKEISIRDACIQHFKDIEHDINIHDITYENTQARERTQILMDIANKENGIVIGTGDLSELALGWATYNGDHMSMYGINVGVPKTLVRYLVEWIADHQVNKDVQSVLYDILDTPVSPELLPPDKQGNIKQKTEEVVGPYELHDFFLYYVVRFGFSPTKIYYLATHAFKEKYDNQTIHKWLHTFYKRFFTQQFKRSCMPDGPKVGSICLSPRGDFRMPSDACVRIWIDEIEKIVI